MYQEQKLYIGKSGEEKVCIYPKMANRHGLIAGATGTGKTVSLRVLAESFSDCGVSVFLADAKGDLASMSLKGTGEGSVGGRVEKLGLEKEGFAYHAYPVTFWDVFGEKGLPLRTTITEIGPLLLSRILNLNDTQSDILTIIFKIADDEGLLLIDTKDLRAMLQYVSENAKELSLTYGNIAKQSLTAIIRAVITLEEAGGEHFFGEPALSISDWIGTDCDGKGKIQILDCQKLMQSPKMYSTFLLWLMSELYETLPEAGDLPKPKMVFFFDEAHMLFDTANRALLEKIEQVVKLIRSKGVGIYFITQNPKDIPDGVLSQLGNKIQHALHAYTPGEQKGAKAAAQAFRENPEFNTYEVLQELAIGEALVSVLNEEGIPVVCETDIHGAITALLVEAAALDDTRSFFADWTIRHPDIENGELLQHCGPWPISVARETPKLTYPLAFSHPGSITAEAKHGEVTLARFDGDNGEYSMLLGKAKGVDGPKGMGTYLWVEVENIKRLEAKIVEGPYIHHCVGIHKDVVPVLYEACKYMGITPDLYDPIEEDVKAYLRGE